MSVFIKIPVAQGSSSNTGYQDDLIFSSVNFNIFRPVATQTGAAQDRTADQPSVGSVTASKLRDKGDIKTLQTLLKREALGTVVISIAYDNQSYNREVTLKNCVLSGWDQTSSTIGSSETNLTFAFSAITIRDNMFDDKGNPKGPGGPTFDITTGQCT